MVKEIVYETLINELKYLKNIRSILISERLSCQNRANRIKNKEKKQYYQNELPEYDKLINNLEWKLRLYGVDIDS